MTKDTELKDKGLYLRGSTYWGRVVVPKALHHVYGKGPLRRSLGTSDRREALARLAAYQAETRAAFQGTLRRLNPETTKLTEALTATLGAAWKDELLREDDRARLDPHSEGVRHAQNAALFAGASHERARAGSQVALLSAELIEDGAADPFSGFNEAQAEAIASQYRRMLDGWRDDSARGRLDVAKRALDQQARSAGLRLDWSQPDVRTILAGFQRLMVETAEMLVARTEGRMVPTPPLAPLSPLRSTGKDTLRDMRDVWERAEAKRRPDTVRKMDRAVGLFEAFIGSDTHSLGQVTHAQASDFRAWLLRQGTAQKTASDHLNHVKTLFAIAARRRVIAHDPFNGVTIKAASRSPREGWSLQDLARLFDAPLFKSYSIPSTSKAGADAAYWVPLLALFTGARVSELCQLRVADVRMMDGAEEPASLPVIDIAEGAEDREAGTMARSVKTANSIRRVPLHPAILDLGFLAYVEAIRAAGNAQLFPAVRVRPGGLPGEYFSTWFGTFKKERGFGRWHDLHNFRHTLRTRLALAGVQESAIDALAGHADGNRGSTGRRTYTHWQANLPALAAEGAKLTLPGVPLSRVFTAPVWKSRMDSQSREHPPT